MRRPLLLLAVLCLLASAGEWAFGWYGRTSAGVSTWIVQVDVDSMAGRTSISTTFIAYMPWRAGIDHHREAFRRDLYEWWAWLYDRDDFLSYSRRTLIFPTWLPALLLAILCSLLWLSEPWIWQVLRGAAARLGFARHHQAQAPPQGFAVGSAPVSAAVPSSPANASRQSVPGYAPDRR